MSRGVGLSLPDGYDLSGLTFWEAHLRYISVGGNGEELFVEACLLGLLDPDDFEHDVLAQALNEHFIDQGEDHPVGYTSLAHNTST